MIPLPIPLFRTLAATAVVFGLCLASESVAQSLEVRGPDGRTATAPAANWADLERRQVVLSGHGETRTYEGPLLIEVLRRIGAAPSGPLRGDDLRRAVLVQAADGYAVAFGLGELDLATRASSVIQADRADGRELTPEEGSLRVVIDGDVRPARSARQVTSITVIDLAPSAERAAGHGHAGPSQGSPSHGSPGHTGPSPADRQ